MHNAINTALDSLTSKHTAFSTFAELVAAATAPGGYTPTIRNSSLAAALTAAGGRVWRG